MIIAITERSGQLSAMGHRVPVEAGGIPELKRRCLETLSRLKDPPDRVWFRLPSEAAETPEVPPLAAPASPGPARLSGSQGRGGRSRR